MKLLKIIEILKDRSQWDIDISSNRITHKPTGIYAYSGYNFWNKEGETIYEPGALAMLFTAHYVRSIKKYLKNRDQENKLDSIYNEWKLNFGNQSLKIDVNFH